MSFENIKIVSKDGRFQCMEITDEEGKRLCGITRVDIRMAAGDHSTLTIERLILDENGNPIANSHHTDVLREVLEFRVAGLEVRAEAPRMPEKALAEGRAIAHHKLEEHLAEVSPEEWADSRRWMHDRQ